MKYFSMFSGIGGFEVGIQNSNVPMKAIGFSEIDKYALSIYTRHFPNHKNYGDAFKINTEDLPDFDFLVGGFPCQAFSIAGKRRGFDDTRGTLFFEIARVLKDKRPRYFLLENVRGLLSHDKGETFKTILEVLSDLGYTVKWSLLNSKDFGVPQRRERVFIEGYSRRECGGEILPFRRAKSQNNELNPNKCVVSKIKRQVVKRKYTADVEELKNLLNAAKTKSKLSNQEIANKLDLPLTLVSHWFRKDNYFSIPTKDVWFDIKKVLNITDDSFDAFLTEFEVVDGEYDMLNRVYSDEGLAPSIKSQTTELICLNPHKSQAQKVYDTNGISCTLSGCGGGQGGKTGLYMIPSNRKVEVVGKINPHQSGMVYGIDGLCRGLTATDSNHPVFVKEEEETKREVKVIGNTSPSNHWRSNVYDPNGISPPCTYNDYKSARQVIEREDNEEREIKVVGNTSPTGHGSQNILSPDGIGRALTATDYKHPLRIKECIGSTQKHASRTDGSYSPALTEAMGKGGGHVPMVNCEESSDLDFRIRKLTPRECERLQAFPDDWTRWGADGEEISDTQRYKCIGNAVTTTVITYLINNMFGA